MKNGKMVKVLALLMAILLLTALVACGDGFQTGETSDSGGSETDSEGESNEETLYYNKTGYPICDEPITLTMMCYAAGNMDLNDRIMVSVFEEKFGIKLDITGFATTEDFVQQLTLAVATDDLPDIIGASGTINMNELLKYANDGYVLPLNEYEDLMPNMQEVFNSYPAYSKYLTAEDGNVYGLTGLEVNEFGRVDRVFINKTWLENVGMPAPTSLDELYDVLCAFRDQDANGNGDASDEIPFDYVASNYWDDQMLLASFGLNADDTNYILSDDGGGKIVFGNTTENYKAYLKYMKKLYDEKLINPECYVNTEADRKEAIANDLTGFFAAPAPFAWGGYDISYDAGFEWVGGLTSEYNSTRTIPMTNTVHSSVVVFASATTQYPEAVARLLDYFYSEEGEVAQQRGWEGVTMDYEYNEILDGDVAMLYSPEGFTSTEDYKINEALVVGPFSFCSRTYGTHYRLLSVASDEVIFSDEDVVNAYGWAVLVGRGLRTPGMVQADVFPNLVFTEEESTERTRLYNDLGTYIVAQRAEFITNPSVDIDKEWDTYVAQLDTIGLAKMLELEQTAYDRFNAN